MRKALVRVDNIPAGTLLELEDNQYQFHYQPSYKGAPVSLTMPINKSIYEFKKFPPFFEGLLPEGMMLEGLLRHTKIDRSDLMGQIIAVGGDLVGNVTVEAVE